MQAKEMDIREIKEKLDTIIELLRLQIHNPYTKIAENIKPIVECTCHDTGGIGSCPIHAPVTQDW